MKPKKFNDGLIALSLTIMIVNVTGKDQAKSIVEIVSDNTRLYICAVSFCP